MQARPHDLLRLADVPGLQAHHTDAPDWVWRSLLETPWAVVRRRRGAPGRVPLGVRGRARHERHAIDVHVDAVAERIRPEDLRGRLTDLPPDKPAARTAVALTEWLKRLDEAGVSWGPAGSVGFQLATGRSVVTAQSDLDLVVRLGSLAAVRAIPPMPSVPGRVDCLVELPEGAVAWAELAAGSPVIMLRTADGPCLVATRLTHPAGTRRTR